MHAHVAYDACLSRVHLVEPREDRRGGVRVLVRQSSTHGGGIVTCKLTRKCVVCVRRVKMAIVARSNTDHSIHWFYRDVSS